MGLLQELENKVLSALEKFFEPVLKPLNRFFKAVKSFFTAFIDLVPETFQLIKDIIAEVQAFRDFKKGFNFKHGVINLKSAKERIQDLFQEIVDAKDSIIDIFKGAKLNPANQINEAAESLAELVESLENFFGKLGLKEALQKFGGTLEKAGGKVFEVLAILQAIAEAALGIVRDIATIVRAIRDIRQTFQTGEGLFLSQANKRKTLNLADGGSIKIRIGSLHAE